MKFKPWKKGTISFGFGPNDQNAEAYKRAVGHHHTGVDYVLGYGKPVSTDNRGYVYMISRFEHSPSGWQAVYLLVPYKDQFIEVIYGHLSRVDVKEGQWVKEDQVVGLEGNYGEVYSGGVRITKAMQAKGDTRGHHVHEQYRPVRPVTRMRKDRHYLRLADGSAYRHKGQFYMEVIYENEQKGCIDPLAFAVSEPKASTRAEQVDTVAAILKTKNDPDHATLSFVAQILRRLGL